jgi:hypothetical protein
MSGLTLSTKKLSEMYKEWRGNESCYDDCRPVFNSSELLDFAEYCLTHEANEANKQPDTKALVLNSVMPRYFIDERAGCAAVRDREHPKYDKDYPGLHQDTPDVSVYAHGFQNHKKGCWEVERLEIDYLKLECDRLNRSNEA